MEAVVVEGSAGATTSTVSLVYILKVGEAPPERPDSGEVFRADHVENLSIAWKGPGVLEISFGEARIFHFSNSSGQVEVRLRPKNPEVPQKAEARPEVSDSAEEIQPAN